MMSKAALAAGLISGALLAGGVQQYRVISVQRALSNARSEYMARVTDAQAAHVSAQAEARRIEQDARARERALNEEIAQIGMEAYDVETRYSSTLADVVADNERLRKQYAIVASNTSSCRSIHQSTPTASCREADRLADILADLQTVATASAAAADRAIRSGMACERAYDAALVATK